MTLPTFLICGIQKGGTTALHAYLASHPDVFCPERKELNFFDQHWEQGLDWYTEFFKDAPDTRIPGKAIGEASPHYMRFAHVAERIQQTLPNARLLFILRDPVARAYSNYTYNLGRGQQDPNESFEAAIASSEGRERYLDKGFYLRDLQAFERVIGRDSMRVFFAEDLRQDPSAVLKQAFDFIGVDPARWQPTTLSSNTTAVPASPFAQQALYQWGRLRRHLQPLVPAPLARATRSMRARALANLPGSGRPEPIQPATQQALQGFFEEANRGLSAWLQVGPESQRALPSWLTPRLQAPSANAA